MTVTLSEAYRDFPGLEVLVRTLGGNESMALRLAQMFLDSHQLSLDMLESAVQCSDLQAIKRIAHDIRGSCAVFAADACLDIARKIENDLAEGCLEEWREDCCRLRQAVLNMAEGLGRFVEAVQGDERSVS